MPRAGVSAPDDQMNPSLPGFPIVPARACRIQAAAGGGAAGACLLARASSLDPARACRRRDGRACTFSAPERETCSVSIQSCLRC